MIDLLDTNVVVRFLTADGDEKYESLYPFFEFLEKGKRRVELKLIVLFQIIFVLKSFYQVPKEKVAEGMLDLLKYKGIFIKEKKTVQRTLELWRDCRNEIVDCYLVACLEKNDQMTLYSYDRGFDRFGIKRMEP